MSAKLAEVGQTEERRDITQEALPVWGAHKPGTPAISTVRGMLPPYTVCPPKGLSCSSQSGVGVSDDRQHS